MSAAQAEARREQPLSRIERIVASRLARSRATIPDFTLELDVEADELLATRERLAAAAGGRGPSVNDFVLRACALALAADAHERLRGRYADERVEIADEVNLGFAVATERGLMVPVIQAADRLSLAELSARARELAGAARDGSIRAADMAGGVMSVTNLGMFGITRFQPVIDPAHAAIVSVGALRDEVALIDGRPVARRRMALTISADHRIVDGAAAARFLVDVQRRLEAPEHPEGAAS